MAEQHTQLHATFRPIQDPVLTPSTQPSLTPPLLRPIPTRPPRRPTSRTVQPENACSRDDPPTYLIESRHDLGHFLNRRHLQKDRYQHDTSIVLQDNVSTPISSSFCLGSNKNSADLAHIETRYSNSPYEGRRIKSFPARPIAPAPTVPTQALTFSQTQQAVTIGYPHLDTLPAPNKLSSFSSDVTLPLPSALTTSSGDVSNAADTGSHTPPQKPISSPKSSTVSSASSSSVTIHRISAQNRSVTRLHVRHRGIRSLFRRPKHNEVPVTESIAPKLVREQSVRSSSPWNSPAEEAHVQNDRNLVPPLVTSFSRQTHRCDRAKHPIDDGPVSLPTRHLDARARLTNRRASLDIRSPFSRDPQYPPRSPTPDRPEPNNPVSHYQHLQSSHSTLHSLENLRKIHSYSEMSQESLLSDLSWESSVEVTSASRPRTEQVQPHRINAPCSSAAVPDRVEPFVIRDRPVNPSQQKIRRLGDAKRTSDNSVIPNHLDTGESQYRGTDDNVTDAMSNTDRDSGSCVIEKSAHLSKPRRMLSLSYRRKPASRRILRFPFGSSSGSSSTGAVQKER